MPICPTALPPFIRAKARGVQFGRPPKSHARTFIAAEHPSQLRWG
jgi:hypothetical protein